MNTRVCLYVLGQALRIALYSLGGAVIGALVALQWAANTSLRDIAYAPTYYIFAPLQKYAGEGALFALLVFVAGVAIALYRDVAKLKRIIKRLEGAQ